MCFRVLWCWDQLTPFYRDRVFGPSSSPSTRVRLHSAIMLQTPPSNSRALQLTHSNWRQDTSRVTLLINRPLFIERTLVLRRRSATRRARGWLRWMWGREI